MLLERFWEERCVVMAVEKRERRNEITNKKGLQVWTAGWLNRGSLRTQAVVLEEKSISHDDSQAAEYVSLFGRGERPNRPAEASTLFAPFYFHSLLFICSHPHCIFQLADRFPEDKELGKVVNYYNYTSRTGCHARSLYDPNNHPNNPLYLGL